ncbi:endolytic transglycosylase MltG [Streptomyces sp. GSL17-111]|uniref:endolytic transglycosylase MltG n=1 Tax=Streptomyces sp. GSL17-111 TaxID=3121596 RepID=UPI0030F47102
MTEYGRGPGSQPWHPEEPPYGDREGDGGAHPGGWDAYGAQPQYPQQPDPYGGWHDPHAATGGPYDQLPADPYGAPSAYPAYYPAPDAYPPPQPQQGYGTPPGQGYGTPPPHGYDAPPQYGDVGRHDPYQQQQYQEQQQYQPYQQYDEHHGPPPAHPGAEHEQAGERGPDDGGADRLDVPSSGAAGEDGPEETAPAVPRRGGGHPGDERDDEPGEEPSTRAGRRTAKGRRNGARRKNRMACLVVVLVLVGGAAGATYAGYSFYQSRFAAAPDYSGSGSGTVQVEIPPGALAGDMAKILAAADVVKSSGAFVEAADANEASKSIQPGIYSLRKQMSAAEALELMLDPASQTGLIVPEGLRATQIYALVDEQTGSPEGTTEEIAESADLGLPAWAEGNVEGLLFPSKYSVSEGSDPEAVLKEMVERAKSEFEKVDLEGQAAQVDKTPYEVLIIASLIQAEAQEKDDFAKVSRVVYNRLKPGNTATNGKLDFDSTINYALDRSTLDVSVGDTGLDHPYNTYKHAGLPPGPIDNPGHQAIEAALNPEDGEWLYFVTVKPGDTRFTETYEEHQEHVKDFNAEQAKKRAEEDE